MFGPDIRAAPVERNDTGTAHFDDLEFLHIFYEGIYLLAVAGSFDTDSFIREIDDLRSEDICRFDDVGMLLFGIPYLDKKELALDTVLSRKDDDFLNVVELTELRDYLILIVLLGSQRDRDTGILGRLGLTYRQRVDVITSSREHRSYT